MFEDLNLEFESLPYWRTLVKETGVTYAGDGYGLCANYTNTPGCDKEQRAMPQDVGMAVLYMKMALMVTLSDIRSVAVGSHHICIGSFPTLDTILDRRVLPKTNIGTMLDKRSWRPWYPINTMSDRERSC